MKAVVVKKYGTPDVLEIQTMDRPQLQDHQVLVEVFASSVNPIDWKMRKGTLKFLIRKNFAYIPGADIAGQIVDVGTKVSEWKSGDKVFGMIDIFANGACAEYVALSAENLALKPQNTTCLEAATFPLAGLTALQALCTLGKIRKGMNVLVNGCSGGVGSFAVQLGKAFGCCVTGVCSAGNVPFAKQLGVDRILNYQTENLLDLQEEYDIFFDVVGNQKFIQLKNLLKPGGIYVSTLPSFNNLILGTMLSWVNSRKMKTIFVKNRKKDLELLADFVEKGLLKTYIDTIYNLTEIADAHRYSETGKVVGKLAIEIKNEQLEY